MNEQTALSARVGTGKGKRNWFSTWWPFGLAWPGTAMLLVSGTAVAHTLDSPLPMVVLFPFAAAASTTELRSVLAAAALLTQLPTYALILKAGCRRRNWQMGAGIVLLLHFVGIGLGSPPFWGPSLAMYGRKLAELAGHEGRDCGMVPLRSDRAAAIRCARTALAAGLPFSVSFQVMGIDSTIYEALAYRAPGHATRVVWDSDISGGSNLVPLRRIHHQACAAPAIADAAGSAPIQCGEIGVPGPSE